MLANSFYDDLLDREKNINKLINLLINLYGISACGGTSDGDGDGSCEEQVPVSEGR
jgi:hypothetical protein